MSEIKMLEAVQETPWWKNRKFMVPLITAIAAIALTYIPNFPFTPDQIAEAVITLWLLVVGGDVLFDNIGQARK